jgi:hypothetical protein
MIVWIMKFEKKVYNLKLNNFQKSHNQIKHQSKPYIKAKKDL